MNYSQFLTSLLSCLLFSKLIVGIPIVVIIDDDVVLKMNGNIQLAKVENVSKNDKNVKNTKRSIDIDDLREYMTRKFKRSMTMENHPMPVAHHEPKEEQPITPVPTVPVPTLLPPIQLLPEHQYHGK